ncbi:MAG: alpha-2-macroglobulin family protein [Chitinophagaceae bacterium]|nr:MAG: alpha-2-macroglobulin family protein [Chitinophagaceae bacterium]
MRIRSFLVPLLAGTIFLAACSRNAVSLSYTNAKGEVPPLGNLVFRFDKSLVNDSVLNNWDSTDYIRFEPAIKGKFRWQGPDELVFSPSEPLKPATSYTASIKNTVLHYSEFNTVKDGDKISFHTPDLILDNAQVIWVGESNTSAVPELNLYFNYAIAPASLKDKLDLEYEGKKVEYQMVTASNDRHQVIRLTGIRPADKEFEVKISIGKGLKPEAGTNETKEVIQSSLSIPSPYVLQVQSMDTEHDGTEGILRFTCSQQVNASDVRAFVKFEPELTFTVDQSDNGFILRSPSFDIEKTYTVTLTKGLRGKLGGTLREDYTGSIAFGELESGVSFTNNKAVYLSAKGGRNLEVRITNVPKIKLVISKIYENNLLLAQRSGYYPQEASSSSSYNEYEGDYSDDSYSQVTMGDVIYEKEIDTRSLPRSNGGRILNFAQFEDRLPDFKGVYHVMIRSTTEYWVRDSRFISVSDLGLIAKQGAEKLVVFTQSIKTALPVNGVNVAVYGANNQLIGTGASNAEGVAEITYTKKDFAGFKPAMVIAKTADDFNFLPFNNTAVNTSRFDVGGKRANPSGLDAFVYSERDMYRPGETLHFSTVIRDKQWKSPGDLPLKIRLVMPNGKEYKAFRKTLNEEGSAEGSIDITNAAITGSYALEVYTSNDVLLTSRPIYVEEFVPDRIKVDAKLDRTAARPGETAALAITATNFFGPPAANRNYETEIQVKQKQFSPEKFSEYSFSLANENSFFDKIVRQGRTSETGTANEQYEIPAAYANRGVLQTNFYSTVFDETGRPVSRAASLDVFTQDVFFGLKKDGYYYYPLNQVAKFNLVAVNKDGNAVNSRAKVEVIKHEYRTVLSKSGSYFRYESQREDKILASGEVTVNGASASPYQFTPRSPGDYEVRVSVPGSATYISQSFYSYGSWGGDNNSFEVNTEGSIDIALEKKTYLTGETIKALFKTPFSGRMLVTVETDHLISYQQVEVSNRTASVDLKVTSDFLPNAYITATLIKPHEMSDIPLTVAHGFKNVTVEEKGRKMDVQIEAKKAVRSKTRQTVKVKAAPGSFVTLSAVDNGVLQISDFQTPDPYDYFYQKKSLQVNAYDLYPLLFAEVRAKLSSTGGDGEMAMDKRNNPMPAKRVKVVSYWSGIKKANGSGVAEFEVDVPAFSGELRLMAVAYKGQNFGANANTMTVADPLVISTALPRFLSPGDTVNIPVTLTNTTAGAASVSASIKTEGPVKLLGAATQSASVAAKGETRVVFNLIAGSSIGVGKINVSVAGLGETFTDATEISVRPPSTLQKQTGGGSVAGGSSFSLAIPTGDYIPSSVNYSLVVGRSPITELGEQLRYLVQYPYGCTEQTISAAFPQLYYGDLAEMMMSGGGRKVQANTNILEAIRKIKMRQLYTGAVTLWDGEGKEDWWSSVYAAHFLLEARKAGFEVETSLLETLLNYVNNKLRNRETISYYYNRDQQKKIAPKEVAYSLYVLALAGRSNVPAMNYYKAKPEVLALDSRYLLSAAYAVAGDKKSFQAMLPAKFAGEESVAQTGGSYYSAIRDEAISLNALLEVDPGNRQIPEMVNHVNARLNQRSWLSTQERAFTFLALGKFARGANTSTATAEIRVNGKTIAKVDGGQWKADMKTLGGKDVQIVTAGTGRMYYSWEAEGISSTGTYRNEDNYMRVRKKFYDRFGKQLSQTSFKQNDLVIVGITLERAYSGSIENVVITDLLPAGFEIENPRTKEIPGMDWIKDASTPTALDVRDDRIHFFVDLTSNRQVYYYAVRAVSPGRYAMGPVSADAMYNGEYNSYNGAGVISIEP